MPLFSLTDFVDVVAASGTPKATKVRQVKRRPRYTPAVDFYKPLRDSIVAAHRHDQRKTVLDTFLAGVTDKKKRTAYPPVVAGYKKWWGRKDLRWFGPAYERYERHGVEVSVNPELGLWIGSTPHLVKLYFKRDPLSKNRVDIITHLMATALLGACRDGTVMSVLDVRRSKLFAPTVPIDGLHAIVDAELAYIGALWPDV